MQRIIKRAVVATLTAFAILTPTGYAMTDPGIPAAADKHDAQLQDVVGLPSYPVALEKHDAQLQDVLRPRGGRTAEHVVGPRGGRTAEETQVLASRGQATPDATSAAPVAAEKHDAQLQDVVRPEATKPALPGPPQFPGPVEPINARGTDVAAADQQATRSVGGRGTDVLATPDDNDGLSTAAISALIALAAMTGLAVALVARRQTRVGV